MLKIIQIILTALSAGGFITSLVINNPRLNWVGGFTSTIALMINLYLLSFTTAETIKDHTNAANDLWEIREAYSALLVDFDSLPDESIRIKREELTSAVSQVNKTYPGTDRRAFNKAKKIISDYTFAPSEADKILRTFR